MSVWTHPNWLFRETIFRPLGVQPLKFLHALRARGWPRLASAHYKPGRGPQNFLGRTFKIWLKIPYMSANNFGSSGRDLTAWPHETLPGDVAQGLGYNMHINFARGAPYKILEGKKRPKFSAIFDNFRLWSRISPDRIYISKIGKVADQQHLFPICRKKLVNFHLPTKKL